MSLNDFSLIKTDLVSTMWKKHIIKVGNYIAKRRKHKLLNTLTLTHSVNTSEIKQLKDDKISKKDDIVMWNCHLQVRMRLESEGPIARGGAKFEHAIGIDPTLKDNFDFDIINLDYTSQNPEKIDGRLEDELLSLEHVIINRRKCLGGKKYSLILFTTMINTCNVLTGTIISASNILNPRSKPLLFSRNSSPMVSPTEKIDIIIEYYNHLHEIYGIEFVSWEDKRIEINNSTFVYSVASIIKW